MTATGALVIGGVTYAAGSAVYNIARKAFQNGTAKKVKSSSKSKGKSKSSKKSKPKKSKSKKTKDGISAVVKAIARKIPKWLKKAAYQVDLKQFPKKAKNGIRKAKHGWEIRPKNSPGNPHGGSKWKLFDKKGRVGTLDENGRVGTLDENGRILRK
ncbi:hypothetical protein [Lactobacillus xylocopicola]|uniref:Uncharacterized protein n=1 Tax=Lactobacillus xylocopicola TaxID=2976676 RepID=A0ABN6SP12_9LACO|nr:hypothetical protein [Lactobacillus xylocopicola]BDR60972.1 hypothetical protein KIM322_12330 [Lactobacillus xylocopicola]